jgi:hypothetical protein
MNAVLARLAQRQSTWMTARRRGFGSLIGYGTTSAYSEADITIDYGSISGGSSPSGRTQQHGRLAQWQSTALTQRVPQDQYLHRLPGRNPNGCGACL